MKFHVMWQHDAESELTDLWLNRADREAITLSANRMKSESLDRTIGEFFWYRLLE